MIEGENINKERKSDSPKIGRNDPCFCGSGKKYKYCHGLAPDSSDHVLDAESSKMTVETFPATLTLIPSITMQSTKSAQRMLNLIDPKTVDKTQPMLKLINLAKKMDEIVVKTAIASDTMSFSDINLDIGELTEEDAKVTLLNYYEIRDRRWGFWRGVGAAVLAAAAAGAIKFFFFTAS